MRPDHLEPVTHAKNLQRGSGTKLTEKQVMEIRSVPKGLFTNKELAAMYGISESHMSRVRRGVKYVLSTR
jgi:DNA-directed RNA polymerase specialized sigma subunit